MTQKIKALLPILCVGLVAIQLMTNSIVANATDLDALASSQESTSTSTDSTLASDTPTEQQTEGTTNSNNGSSVDAMTNYLSNYEYFDNDNMEKAQKWASPIVNVIGNIIGFIVLITASLIGLITVVDLVYIGIPATRDFLRKDSAPMQQQATPMGGMGMGGYGMGRMGGYGMGGMAQPQQQSTLGGFFRRSWVSDEAVAALYEANSQQMATQAQAGGVSPMGMGGMGGMGMMGGMGGMGMAQPQQQATPAKVKSPIAIYLKKRAIFLLLFTVATVLLLSSAFTKSGINVAQMALKLIDKFNVAISNVNI